MSLLGSWHKTSVVLKFDEIHASDTIEKIYRSDLFYKFERSDRSHGSGIICANGIPVCAYCPLMDCSLSTTSVTIVKSPVDTVLCSNQYFIASVTHANARRPQSWRHVFKPVIDRHISVR